MVGPRTAFLALSKAFFETVRRLIRLLAPQKQLQGAWRLKAGIRKLTEGRE
jgi:hypothetical protein